MDRCTKGCAVCTKGCVVETVLRGQQGYVATLVTDLVYAKVAIPRGWREPADATVMALDATAQLDAEQARRCRDLTHKALALIHIAVTLVRDYITQHQVLGWPDPTRPPDKNDLDSLRRGRGPAALRDLMFRELESWPGTAPEQLRDGVGRILDEALSTRRTSQQAPTRTRAEMQRLLGPALGPVREIVLEWAAARRLPADTAEEVVSEALDQLYRTVAKIGRAPDDLRRWTRATCAKKWRVIVARLGITAQPVAAPEEYEQFIGVRDTVGDEAAGMVDLNRWMRDAAAQLRRLGDAYAAEQPAMLDDALSCAVAADLLDTNDVDLVIAVVQASELGAGVLAAQLARHGHRLSPDRKIAVQRLISDTLRRIHEGNA